MNFIDIMFIAFVLSLDAFSVSISCGIKLKTKQFKKYIKISMAFGIFQALMPIGGWLLGHLFKDIVGQYAPWISFSVFFLLGLKTFYDVWKDHTSECGTSCSCDNHLCLFNLAIATSIDAFLVGIILSLHSTTPFYISLPLIGATTIVMSLAGCLIGNIANTLLKRWSLLIAGVILIGLAIRSII